MKKGWQTKTLGDVLEKTETVNPLQSPSVEFDYIDVSSVSNTTFEIQETQRLKEKDAPSRARKLVRTNDIIFATIRPTLQRIAVVPEHLDKQVCSTGYFVLRPKLGIDHRFVIYSLFTENFVGQMESLQKGASYPAVTDGYVRAQEIPVPPLAEQQRIVGVLDEAFEGLATAKANAEKNLQNARALFESHLQSVFTPRGPRWVEKPLGEIADLLDCLHKTPTYAESGFPMVRVTDINPGFLDLSKTRKVDEQTFIAFSKGRTPRVGDIVFSRVGSCGVSALVNSDEPFCLGQNTVFILPKMNLMLLYHFLNSPNAKEQFEGFIDGTTQPTISMKSIRQVAVPIAPPAEHSRLVASLDSMREETQRLARLYERKHAALEALKKSLLHQAFTGAL